MTPVSTMIARATRHPDRVEDDADLKLDIGLGHIDAPEPVEHRTHLRRTFALLLGTILLVGILNWAVDPTGVTGRTTKWQVADNSAVRTKKIDLYLALDEQPDVIFMGSSRTMKFEPSHVEELTGQNAFNAAVSGGLPRDILQFTRMLAAEHDDDFPHLVWGLDVDAFRHNELRANLATDRRLLKYVPVRRRISQSVARVGVLLEWQTTKATLRALRRGVAADPGAKGLLATRTYSADGFQEWSLNRPEPGEELEAFVQSHAERYATGVFEGDGYSRIEDEPLGDFMETIRIANANGDVPTIMITPFHPVAAEILDTHGMSDRAREVFEMLDRVREEDGLEFEVVDLSDLETFEGDPDEFYDAIHMTTENTRRMIEVLHDEGAFEPASPRDSR